MILPIWVHAPRFNYIIDQARHQGSGLPNVVLFALVCSRQGIQTYFTVPAHEEILPCSTSRSRL